MSVKGYKFWIYLVIAGTVAILSNSCRKEERADYSLETGSVKDIDGNVYKTMIIGNQEWMTENLKTTRFNDGRRIDYPGSDNPAWINNRSGAYAWYGNDISYKNTYGALYNWHAVNNGNLCPAGWHVPDDAEWTLINKYLAGKAGAELKETGTAQWQGINSGASAGSGFKALPGGVRFSDMPGGSRNPAEGYYYYMGRTGRWWSSSGHSNADAWYRSIHHDSGNMFRSHSSKETGFSVRCVRNLN